MNNAAAARVFNEVAVLLELKGEDDFRVLAYRRVGRAINDLNEDLAEVASRGELEQLPGVGKAMAEKITELLREGRLSVREDLLREVPESLLRLLAVPSLGAKKVAVLWKRLGIISLDDLKIALRTRKLDDLPGFGPKTINQLQRGIEFIERSAGRTRIGMAWKISTLLGGQVLGMRGMEQAEFAGSLRRGRETVGNLDLLCAADEPADVIREFCQLQHVTQVIVAAESRGAVLVNYEPYGTLRVDLRVVPARAFGAAWLMYTGSDAHYARLVERAAQRGLELKETGLFDADRFIAGQTEEEIYHALGMPWVPPELREDRGEFEVPEIPRDLLVQNHLRGELHMHTVASDGRNTIEEMAQAARDRGYEYICITDHSQSSVLADGLKPEVLLGHIHDVHAVGARMPGLEVLAGSEVDILSDGRLDYADDVLAQLDWVMASVHAAMTNDIEKNTRRTLAAIRNPYVNCISHPTGRLINEREAMPIDIEAIAREAARTGTALEINANNFRLDLKDEHARLARDLGAMILINTDAHATDQFDQIRFGVMTARRGWLRKDDVLNTRSAAEIRQFAQAKRARLRALAG
ncbi:MAG: DNA polymerase/3'-5' exonuclease PolX [Phycisphaerales bacterium]|nr:DNA polymerase/3'-5' exonuclease PolX [Phycisphaerales bacterium]